MASIVPDDQPDFPVYVSDVRRAGYCTRGARGWFAAHGLPWADFISPAGVSAKLLASYEDALANTVVEAARSRQPK